MRQGEGETEAVGNSQDSACTDWTQLGKRRRQCFSVFLSFFPLVGIVAFSFFIAAMWFPESELVFPVMCIGALILMGGYYIVYWVTFLRLLLYRCPRCQKKFFGPILFKVGVGWASSKTCFYCRHGPDFSPRI